MEQNSITLDEVKSHFERWRATRSKLRERIPQHLWDEVKAILDRYPLAEVTKSLRINAYQMCIYCAKEWLSGTIHTITFYRKYTLNQRKK